MESFEITELASSFVVNGSKGIDFCIVDGNGRDDLLDVVVVSISSFICKLVRLVSPFCDDRKVEFEGCVVDLFDCDCCSIGKDSVEGGNE